MEAASLGMDLQVSKWYSNTQHTQRQGDDPLGEEGSLQTAYLISSLVLYSRSCFLIAPAWQLSEVHSTLCQDLIMPSSYSTVKQISIVTIM